MKSFLKFLLGVFLVALIGLAALWIEKAPGSVVTAETKLRERATEALGVSGSEWAHVNVDGQKIILTGEAPSEEARQMLMERIASSEWRGGVFFGGVTAIDDSGLAVAPPPPLADPFTLIGEYEGGSLILSGHVPSQNARDSVYQLAGGAFSGAEISGTLDIARGVPADERTWLAAVKINFDALAKLQKGASHISDVNITIAGEADDDADAQAARALIASLPEPFNASTDITVSTPPPTAAGNEEVLAASSDDAQEAALPAPAAEVEEPETPDCADLLQTAVDARRIGFSSARADVDSVSRSQLREIAAIMAECPEARLRITGHTDASGNTSRNLQLSGYRADAVRAFLTSVGIAGDRLTARGVGSSEPLADNDTPQGRELNRRIEIEVIVSDE